MIFFHFFFGKKILFVYVVHIMWLLMNYFIFFYFFSTGFNLKDWKPCMGCRSHWIHVVCGGFCSECQPLSPAIVDTVKSIYSSTGTGTEVASKIRRSSDRSPLSVKQSQLAKRLQDSSGNSIFCFLWLGFSNLFIWKHIEGPLGDPRWPRFI